MNSQPSYMAWFVLECSLHTFIKYIDYFYHQNLYNYFIINTDLTFKSQTCQGRHVNSHPPDGVDLCQLQRNDLTRLDYDARNAAEY